MYSAVGTNCLVGLFTNMRLYPLQKQVGPEHTTENIAPVQAPFAMPEMNRPVFKDVVCSIVETGAKPEKMVTKAIQKAIDKVSRDGGRKSGHTCRYLENGSHRVEE